MAKKKKLQLWKYSGILLIITGAIHTVVGLLFGWEIYGYIIRDGVIDAVRDDYTRAFAFWFLLFGVLLMLFGQVLHYYIRREKRPAPAFVGWWLLAISVVGCAVEPVSGFWIVLPQAIIIIFGAWQKNLTE